MQFLVIVARVVTTSIYYTKFNRALYVERTRRKSAGKKGIRFSSVDAFALRTRLLRYGRRGEQPSENKDGEEGEEEGKATGHAVNDYRDYPRCWLTATNALVQARRGARARDAGCRTGLRYYQADAVAR